MQGEKVNKNFKLISEGFLFLVVVLIFIIIIIDLWYIFEEDVGERKFFLHFPHNYDAEKGLLEVKHIET